MRKPKQIIATKVKQTKHNITLKAQETKQQKQTNGKQKRLTETKHSKSKEGKQTAYKIKSIYIYIYIYSIYIYIYIIVFVIYIYLYYKEGNQNGWTKQLKKTGATGASC